MEKNFLYSRPHLEKELSGEKLNKEIQEMDIFEGDSKLSGSKCELCVVKNPLFERVAVFLCFKCEMYVCVNCISDHRAHEGIKVENIESDRDKVREEREIGKMGEQTENERTKYHGKGLGKTPKRMRQEEGEIENEMEKERENTERKRETVGSERKEENCERKKMVIKFVDELINESEIERKEKLKTSRVNIYDRVKVRHELDEEDCKVTGLCGLESKRWVVCDRLNSCIKIFKLGRNVLQRYIRFDSQPWDVTEIHEKQNSDEPSLVSSSNSDISVTDKTEQGKQCLIGVTLPWKRQITFIALHEKPAFTYKIAYTEKACYFIEFYDDKIFTVCREDLSPCSVYIKCTDGDTLKTFDTGISSFVPHLAVAFGRVYLSDFGKNKVQCINIDGQVISENTMKRIRPAGISVDPDCNVYVCASLPSKLYKLDSDLIRYMSVLDQSTDHVENPDMLCYYRDKLFVSHLQMSSFENFVTVVRLL